MTRDDRAGCLATLKPLFQRFLARTETSSGSFGSSMMLGGRDNYQRPNGYTRRSSGVFLDKMRPDLQNNTQGTVTRITGQALRGQPSKSGGFGRIGRGRSQNDNDSLTESREHITEGQINKSVELTYEEMEIMENGELCTVRNA